MPFAYPHLSIVALLAAAAAQFVLGFLWYSQMTPIGRTWVREMHLGDQEPQAGAEMAVFPIGSLLAAWAVTMVVAWSGATGVAQAVLAAWVIALAVGAQVVATSVATNHRSMSLLAINVGYLVVGYAIMGAIVGALS